VAGFRKTRDKEDSNSQEIAMRRTFGRYLVVDTKICHGQPTFRGTRILVQDVLEQVAQGMAWETIEEQWRGAVNQAAIAEAVRLAGKALLEHLPGREFVRT
jgi:uncharacterized protein (DUF433 family)